MPAETMWSWTPAAVEAWATVFAALAAVVGVPFLLWDKLAARPHGVNGYVVLARLKDEISIYLVSDIGERIIITAVDGGAFFSLDRKDPRTPAQKHTGMKHVALFRRRLKVRKVVPHDHAGDEPVGRYAVRLASRRSLMRRLARLLERPRITVEGVLPYRRRRFRVELDLVDSSLRMALLRREQNSQAGS